MLDDLTPEKDGVINVNLEDDVIREATVCHQGKGDLPPPAQAIGEQKSSKPVELTAEKELTIELQKERLSADVKPGCWQLAACLCC